MHVVFSCFIILLYGIFLSCVVFVLFAGCLHKKMDLKQIRVVFFCAWSALWYFVLYILHVWNALWYYCIVFFAHGARSGVIMLNIPHVECALTLLCYMFPRVERVLLLLCYIFLRVELAMALLYYNFPCLEHALALLCYISASGTR